MTARKRLSRSDKCALATLLFLLALSAAMHVIMPGLGDKEWLLYAASQWVDGKRLYVKLVEVNPPLILWLYGFIVWLSRKLGMSGDYHLLGVLGLVVAALVIWLCAALIRGHAEFADNARKRVQFMLLLAALFVFITPPAYFFDREHIMFMMTFPYVLRFMPGVRHATLPLALRAIIGLFAALGFCIKPHSILLFAGVQAMALWRERRLSVLFCLENVIIAFAALAYGYCVWRFAPEYLSAVLPMAMATYSYFSRAGSSLLNLPSVYFCFGLTFAEFRPRYATPYRKDVYYFLGIALVYFIHTVISNGWDYTYHPLMCTVIFLSGWLLLEYQWLNREAKKKGNTAKLFVFGIRGASLSLAMQGVYTALVVMLSTNVAAINHNCEHTPECLLKDAYIGYVHDNNVKSFGTITLDYAKWLKLIHFTQARWVTRFNHLWMMPRLMTARDLPATDAWMTPYVARALADDLNHAKPDIVFVDANHQFFAYPDRAELAEFLSRVPEFKEAWAHYRLAKVIDGCKGDSQQLLDRYCRYEVYTREK